ncbi:MAG: hypothetical protein AAGG02_09150 [Cyanobacteria bacterium P01_H01_bin.15]
MIKKFLIAALFVLASFLPLSAEAKTQFLSNLSDSDTRFSDLDLEESEEILISQKRRGGRNRARRSDRRRTRSRTRRRVRRRGVRREIRRDRRRAISRRSRRRSTGAFIGGAVIGGVVGTAIGSAVAESGREEREETVIIINQNGQDLEMLPEYEEAFECEGQYIEVYDEDCEEEPFDDAF